MEDAKKRIAIIGGGVAGLTAGIYAQLYGFDSVIYEKHSISGGQCTGWNRKGYHIDGCLHWLTGTKPGTPLYTLWEDTGVLGDSIEVIQLEDFGSYNLDGVHFHLYRDIQKLESELLRIAPEDAPIIQKLIHAIKVLQKMPTPADAPVSLRSLPEKIALLLKVLRPGLMLMKYNKVSCANFMLRLKSPILRNMFKNRLPPTYSISSLLFGLGMFTSDNGGIPRGGSVALAQRMEQRFIELGGVIQKNCEVSRIVIKNRRAVSLECGSATVTDFDYIVPACDPDVLFGKLVDHSFCPEPFTVRYNNKYAYAVPSSVLAVFSIDVDISSMPHSLSFNCEPYITGKRIYSHIEFRHYCFEPTFAPKGKSVINMNICQSDDDFDYWWELRKDKAAYTQKKQELAEQLIVRMERQFPQLQGKIEYLDMATPATYHRYTGAYHGGWMSWILTAKGKMLRHSGKLPGIKNCYMAGQWLQPPGGLPIAAMSGKYAIQRIAAAEGIITH